jgi:hypothetical protein
MAGMAVILSRSQQHGAHGDLSRPDPEHGPYRAKTKDAVLSAKPQGENIPKIEAVGMEILLRYFRDG